ncbi:MAG: lipoyl(octanoyl) transferase LipB [Chitinophagia bacterium]|jgi:lipoyl(octanoyl) transferase|nr:lipoyl(octanoyl) transferase LipB [Chitinophagia bacterium]NCA29789.1 lipoyl(octanoyl) transferase LipB [Chitinophagia bacterium]NDD16848.1 lipoyl(octanoyl) transferase LipB [Chitinophagia bacterium]
MRQKVFFEDMGIRSYQPSWDYQEELLLKNTQIKWAARQNEQDVKTSNTEHRLLLVEHNPVFTLGKSGKREHILVSEDQLKNLGIEFFHINRGGDVTYHGLQQIVGYPILDLDKFKTDLGWYLRSLEQVIIDVIAEYGLKGERSVGETGVWLDPTDPFMARKICAMGIKCSRWITMHGFALNVNTDLSHFEFIVPCGIQGKTVTSLEKELGHKVNYEEVKEKVKKHFQLIFDCELV